MKTTTANICTLLLGALLLASCGQNTGPASNPLDGTWRCVQINGEDARPLSTEYSFVGKKLTIKQGPLEKRGDILKMTSNDFFSDMRAGKRCSLSIIS